MKFVNRAYKYRFYPTEEQEKLLAHSFGCSRFIYNRFLKLRTDAYYERQEKVNYHKTSELLTALKKEESFSWLKDVSSVTLQQTLRDLDKAFTNFFAKRTKYPKFKKKNSRQSIRFVDSAFSFSEDKLTLAKHKEPLNIRWSRKFSAKPSSVTISKDCANRYFVSFALEEPICEFPKIEKKIGIDVGIKDICVTSDGVKSGSPQYLGKYSFSVFFYPRFFFRTTEYLAGGPVPVLRSHSHDQSTIATNRIPGVIFEYPAGAFANNTCVSTGCCVSFHHIPLIYLLSEKKTANVLITTYRKAERCTLSAERYLLVFSLRMSPISPTPVTG